MTGVIGRAVRLFRREVLRDPFLLAVKRWFRDKGDDTRRLDYPLDHDSIVWDVGGFHGDFAARIHQRYGCRVWVFEPVPVYYRHCVERFAGNERIRCLPFGLSARAGWFDISDSGDASSFVRSESGCEVQKAELRPVTTMFSDLGIGRVDLLKINIEGGEYDVLPALIESGLIERVRYIQVQFHDFVPDAASRREAIRRGLARTHSEMWNYPFVWESWARQPPEETGGMRSAVLVGDGVVGDGIFRLDSPGNRDGCHQPYALLAALLRERSFVIHTPDCLAAPPAFELHMNAREATGEAPCYLLMLETPAIHPANGDRSQWGRYRKIFTWNDELVDGERFIKLNFPNSLVVPEVDGFAARPRLCCMIAGNKTVVQPEARELYTERVRAIRWFENNAPADFDLYGGDWDLPPAGSGVIGKIARRLGRHLADTLPMKLFPSWRGQAARKRDVLLQTRFSICYENVCDLPGYITEKIFDCFFAGCVPVYWGASNVTDHIPADCFIDRRKFADTASVYAHLRAMGEDEHRGYQRRIAAFLASAAAQPFGADAFAETIVNAIVKDLGSQA